MIPRLRIICPLLLALLGIGVLTGCIFIPTFGVKLSGVDRRSDVGDHHSGRQFSVGECTEEQVVNAFGKPGYVSSDGRTIAYVVNRGYWLWLGLCNGFDQTAYAVILRFDEAGGLHDYEVTEHRSLPVFLEYEYGLPNLPESPKPGSGPDLRNTNRLRLTPDGWSVPLPATRPTPAQ